MLASRPYPYVTKTLENTLSQRRLDANVKAQTYFLRSGNVFRIRYMQDVVTTYFPTFLLRTDMVLMLT
jgi:hypothetical protein